MLDRLIRTILAALVPFFGCLVGCAVSLTPTHEIRWTQTRPPDQDADASRPAATPTTEREP